MIDDGWTIDIPAGDAMHFTPWHVDQWSGGWVKTYIAITDYREDGTLKPTKPSATCCR